jgi:deferrochelatase/peroxidase EfeB
MSRRGLFGLGAADAVDGSDGLGRLDAGLFFIAYQPIQLSLAKGDSLNEYIKHVSSGLFACPSGVRDAGDYWGRDLFMD